MSGRETTKASIPSDNATLDEEPGAAKAVLHRDIEACLPNLRRYARSLTRDAVAADDLVQDASFGPSRSFISGERDGPESVVIHHSAQPVRHPAPPSHP